MESTEVLELHRDVRGAVGYKGKRPSEEKINAALCAVKAAYRTTKWQNSNGVEIAILSFATLVALLLCWHTVKRYMQEKGSVLGACARVAAIVVGLELLVLVFFGGIRDREVANARIRDKLFPELFDLKGGLQADCGRRAADPPDERGEGKEEKPAQAQNFLSGVAEAGKAAGLAAAEAASAAEAEAAEELADKRARFLRLGLVRMDTERVAAGIVRAMSTLRRLAGASSVREPDDTDVDSAISDVLVPAMLQARRSMKVGSPAYGEPAETCSEHCAEEARWILAAFEAGDDVSAERLERAWADCPDSMREMCGSMKKSQDRCAAMCNSTLHQVRRFHTVLGYAPGADWEQHKAAKSEAQCWKACGDDYDAAMFVREEGPKGSAKCYLHGADSSYEEFRTVQGAAGVALVKDGSPMVLPGNDPAHAAEQIAEEMRDKSLVIDLAAHADRVMEELRAQAPSSYDGDRAWFRDCLDAVAVLLASSGPSTGRVPNAGHFTRELQAMTADEFQKKVTWPVLGASVFVGVRAGASDDADSALTAATMGDIRAYRDETLYQWVFWTFLLAAGLAAADWLVRDISADPRGKLRALDRHLPFLAVLGLLVTLGVTQFRLFIRKRRVNREKRRENVDALVSRVCALSRLLLDVSASLPPKEGEETCPSAGGWEEVRTLVDVRTHVYAGDMSLLKPFPEDQRSSPVYNILTPKQRNDILAGCLGVVNAYDVCNSAAVDATVPFPVSELVTYGVVGAGALFAIATMYTRIDGPELFAGARRVKAALQAAREGKPGAVGLLREEMLSASAFRNPLATAATIAKYLFITLAVALMIILGKESAVNRSRLAVGRECAA